MQRIKYVWKLTQPLESLVGRYREKWPQKGIVPEQIESLGWKFDWLE